MIGSKKEWKDDEHWNGPHIVMRTKPRYLANLPLYVPIQEIVKNVNPPLSIFPDRKFKGIRFKDRTAVKINAKDFKSIEDFIKKYERKTEIFNGPANDENLGAPIDLGVLNYAPTSEQGVVALFVHFMKKLKNHKFEKIEFIRAGFPDSCVIEKIGNTYSRKYIEFEFRASKFREHIKNLKHRKIKCDYVVCWENDYLTCPLEVIELKSDLEKLDL